MTENEHIIGTCFSMCPENEIIQREQAGLIHDLERCDHDRSAGKQHSSGVREKRQRQQGYNQYQRGVKAFAKADRLKTVKEYKRPAAGINKTDPSDLRPSPILKKTVAYLCTKILTRTDRPFIDIYDFVFDRLRAVRQDMVIQRIGDRSAILIMESIVNFHVYAEYRFRKDAPHSYDPTINRIHLRDCLKSLLVFYELNGESGPSRPFYEALNILHSSESYEVISRAFKIMPEMKGKESEVFYDALDICLAIQNKNFYKFFKQLIEFPPLLAGFIIQRVPSMRIHAFRAISVAYGVTTCKIPIEWLEELLCYPNQSCLEKDLVKIGCKIVKTEKDEEKVHTFAKFEKTNPLLKTDHEITVNTDVKLIITSGLNNIDIIATEQICPWGLQYLSVCDKFY